MISFNEPPGAMPPTQYSNQVAEDRIPFNVPRDFIQRDRVMPKAMPDHLTGEQFAKEVISAVAGYFQLSVDDITGPRRPEHIAFPRQVAMWIVRSYTRLSLSRIGEQFGHRDHGTVLHAFRLVADRIEVCPLTATHVQRITTALELGALDLESQHLKPKQ